jgi:hypothetical protein
MRIGPRITSIAVVLMFVFMMTTVYLWAFQEECAQGEDAVELDELLFFTDKERYEPGEDVKFILQNNGSESLLYDTELEETIQIFGPSGAITVMEPYIQTCGLSHIPPGENLTSTWNQTYYLYVNGMISVSHTLDYRTWTQVPTGIYTARLNFGNIKEEVKFEIGP